MYCKNDLTKISIMLGLDQYSTIYASKYQDHSTGEWTRIKLSASVSFSDCIIYDNNIDTETEKLAVWLKRNYAGNLYLVGKHGFKIIHQKKYLDIVICV